MLDELQGRVALVTGSSQGLGMVTAKAFAAEGCHVYVNCVDDPEKAEAVVADIAAAGGSAEFALCDVSNENDVAATFRSLKPIDILVNNARLNPYSRTPDDSEAEWFARMLAVNLIGPHLTMLAVMKGMKERRWGRIINISSIQAHVAVPLVMAPYAASKGGLNVLSRTFARECAPFNVTVNTVSPGMIVTENILKNLTPEEVEERNQRIPLHRGATPEEVAGVIVNTARCGYMTGEIVNVNGGLWYTP